MAPAIGLDIGSSAVRAAVVRHGRKGSALERIGQVDLPHGAVRDGEIVQPDAVVAALKQLWRRYRIKSRKVAIGLANQQVVVRRLDIPYMTDNELRASLSLQVDGLIPIAVDQAVMDYCMLGERRTPDGARQVRILLVAAQVDMVNALIDVVRRARLQPVSVDLDAFAALRSLAPSELFDEPTAEMLVDVGATVTDVVVHHNGTPHFARTLLFGGLTITESLMDELDLDRETAEALKIDGEATPVDVHQQTRVSAEVRTQTQRLIDEVRGSIDYCAAQRDIPAINRIVVTGGTSLLPDLPAHLADALNLDVATGSPFASLSVAKGATDVDDPAAAEAHLAVAVGLAMGAAA